MKTHKKCQSIAAGIAALFLLGLVSVCPAQEPIVLKFSYAPPQTGIQGQGYEFFAKTVSEESGGQVQVKTFPAGSLISDHDILDAVTKGTVDIGHFFVAYLSPTIKELTPFEVPGAYPGNRYLDLEKATRPIVDRIFTKYGIKYLGLDDTGTMTFLAVKKVGKTIAKPSDFKGHTVRTPGKWGGEAIMMWGGSPVTVPLRDVPTALGRGTIDVGYIGWQLAGSLKLYESAPFVTITQLPELFRGMMMSGRAWQKLNTSQQEAVQRAVQKWMAFNMQNGSAEFKKFEKTVKDAGNTVYYLTPDENEEFRKAKDTLWEKIMPIAGPEGKELIDTLKSFK